MRSCSLLTVACVVCVPSAQADQYPTRPAHGVERFGCQARTFGEGIYADETTFVGVVRQIGEVGFEGVETNWKNLERYFDRPAVFLRILKDSRLELIGAHIGGSPWTAAARAKVLDDVNRTARFVKAVGGSFVVFSGAYPKARPVPETAWSQMAEFMNEVGRICANNGVRCLYHNHWVECDADGLERLCRLTDPKLVGFAFDTGHALRAGKDPAAVIAVLGKRLGLVHLADSVAPGPTPPHRPPLGDGRLKIAEVAAALRKVNFDQWIVLEEETSSAGRSLAERGLKVFRTAFPPGK